MNDQAATQENGWFNDRTLIPPYRNGHVLLYGFLFGWGITWLSSGLLAGNR